MELLRLGPIGHERPAVRHDGVTYDLASITKDIDGRFLAGGGITHVRHLLRSRRLPVLEGADRSRKGSPIARPGAVVCIGQNYAAHAAESGANPPERPIVFFKHPNTVVGPDDSITLPPGSTTTDWEVELAVIIGSRMPSLGSVAEANAYIAGYALANDVSERTLQIEQSGGQWSKGKSASTFCPLGPVLVPANEIDPRSLGIRSWVNGQARQDSTTADMIFPVLDILYDLSQYMVLDPGDVVLTGTPEGVGLSGRFPYLRAGDVVDLEIDHLGCQTQRVVESN